MRSAPRPPAAARRLPAALTLALAAACGGPAPAPSATPAPPPAAPPPAAAAPSAAAAPVVDGCVIAEAALKPALAAAPQRVGPAGDCVVTGAGAAAPGADPEGALHAAFADWETVLSEAADGPTGSRSAHKKEGQTCQLTLSWPEGRPADGAWSALVECKRTG